MLGVKEYPYGISSGYEKYPGGGTAKYVIALAEKLAEFGHNIILIVRRMPGQIRIESIDGIEIYRVPWINNKYLRLPTFSIFSFFKALGLVKKIDIIHAHGSFDAISGVILGRIFNKKVIGTPHGLTSYQAKNKYNKITVYLTKLIEKWGFNRLNKMIYISNDEKILIEKKLGIKPTNYDIINMGIQPLNIIRKHTKKFKIIFVGRLVPSKGIDKLILSYKYLPAETKRVVEYIIVGDGFYKKELMSLAVENYIESKIIFTGFKNQIEEYLSDASLFILPSEGGEGLPVSLLEAISSGIPCLVSNFKLSIKCKSIIYLKDNNPKTIAAVIYNLFNNKERLNKLNKCAKFEFEKFFSINKTAQEYNKTYLNMINKV